MNLFVAYLTTLRAPQSKLALNDKVLINNECTEKTVEETSRGLTSEHYPGILLE
jgi:hypothetical protein